MLFKDLKAYQHARRLSVLSRPLIKRLPDSERDLADQWRRACNSIALNPAEGVSRRGSKEIPTLYGHGPGIAGRARSRTRSRPAPRVLRTVRARGDQRDPRRVRQDRLWLVAEAFSSG